MALGLRFYRSSNGVICCPGAAISMRQYRPLMSPTFNSIARVLELLAGVWQAPGHTTGKSGMGELIALVGGRNIADTYFGTRDADTRNSVDADMLLVGPKVDAVAALFDRLRSPDKSWVYS